LDIKATYELVFRNATIIDGTGAPSRPGDVGVSGGRISAVGRLGGRGEFELDCTGLHLAPGFIDIHSHSDFSIFRDPGAPNYVAQGVTLLLSGNCGFSGAPTARPTTATRSLTMCPWTSSCPPATPPGGEGWWGRRLRWIYGPAMPGRGSPTG